MKFWLSIKHERFSLLLHTLESTMLIYCAAYILFFFTLFFLISTGSFISFGFYPHQSFKKSNSTDLRGGVGFCTSLLLTCSAPWAGAAEARQRGSSSSSGGAMSQSQVQFPTQTLAAAALVWGGEGRTHPRAPSPPQLASH